MPCLFRKSEVVNPPIPEPIMIAFMLTPSLLPLDVWARRHFACSEFQTYSWGATKDCICRTTGVHLVAASRISSERSSDAISTIAG
jgi:hypothetical protein